MVQGVLLVTKICPINTLSPEIYVHDKAYFVFSVACFLYCQVFVWKNKLVRIRIQ